MPSGANWKLPDPEIVTYYLLNKERKIWIDVSVDATILEYERMILLWNMEDKGKEPKDRKPIWIYLMNFGGSLEMCYSFIDTLLASKTPVFTVNMGQCASAGGLIFMAGQQRFMMPNATVMIHEGSAQFAGDAGKIMDQTEVYKEQVKHMKEYILSRTEIPVKLLNKKRSNDWEIPAKECLQMKVCDRIIETLDDII